MEKEEVYDRVELCNNIISLIQNSDETQAYILYSGIGVGKSSVSQKISKLVMEKHIEKDVICIKAYQNDNTGEWTFLNNIFNSIRKYYLAKGNQGSKSEKKKYKKYSYQYFIRHQNFSTIKKLLYNFNNYSGKEPAILRFIDIIIKYICIKLEIKEELENKFNDNNISVAYIKYVLKKANVVLGIDGTQKLDRSSFDSLIEILIETKPQKNYFIFEFTLDNESDSLAKFQQLGNELKYSEIQYNKSELKKLEMQYVIKIARKYYDSEDDTFILGIKKLYNGNLKKVENFALNYSLQTVASIDPTLKLLQQLSDNQKYILAIIILNNGGIKEDILKKIINNTPEIYVTNYNEDLVHLTEENLLVKADNSVYIKDGDTVDSWNKNINIFTKYEAIAYKNCEDIYLRMLQNEAEVSLSHKECIILLFQLYNKFDAIKLNNILERVDEVIYEFLSVNDLEKYLKQLIEILYTKEKSVPILYNIFDICDRHQFIDLEAMCLEKIKTILKENYDEKYLFCYYKNLLHREAYKHLLEETERYKTEEFIIDFKYYIKLFRLVAYASLNRKAEIKRAIEILEGDSDFLEKVPYGYYLRLAEAYDKRNVAIPKVEKSVSLFKKLGLMTQAAESQVSLAFLYSITGKLEKATTSLDDAEKILEKNIENRHVFNINKACILLLNRHYGKDVWELLNEAEKYSHLQFDKIAIIINKLILCIENSDFSKGKYYEKKGLELLELESNHHLHAIFYYNCYALYNKMQIEETAQKYYCWAVKNKQYCDTLSARLEGKTEVEDQTTFLLQYPWHVCFVSYWQFNYILSK